MTSKLDIDDLQIGQKIEDAHVLSIYLQISAADSTTPLRSFDAAFKGTVESLEHGFEEDVELREFKSCLSRVRKFLAKCEPRAKTLILFCRTTGSLWVRQIDVALSNDLRWDDIAFVRPLAEALDEYERFAVLLTGAAKSRLFSAAMGVIHEHSAVRRKAGEEDAPYLRRAIEAGEALMRAENPARLILAGVPALSSKLLQLAGPALQSKVKGVLNLPVESTLQQILDAAGAVESNAARNADLKDVNELLDLAAEGKEVAVGIDAAVQALNDGRLWQLVYAEGFVKRGGRCPVCDGLSADELQLCKACNVAVRPVEDLVDVMVARALAAGGSIEEVHGPAARRLNKAGGVGAFLRY